MEIKAVLLDFDGTLILKDSLEIASEINGTQKASRKLWLDFHQGRNPGLAGLVDRINLLQGISLDQLEQKLEKENYLRPGALELFEFLNQRQLVSIINSGSIEPILEHYQKKLKATYIVGTRPQITQNRLHSITVQDIPGRRHKLVGIKKILGSLSIQAEQTVAIGDSVADKTVFEFAGKSIAIDPKGGIEQSADFVIKDDLTEALVIIKKLLAS